MIFPQSVFVKKIISSIEKEEISPFHIIDAPCGNGYVSQKLAEHFPSTIVKGIDLEENRDWNSSKNLSFEMMDIHQFIDNHPGQIEYFCLINSIFLLPKPHDLLIKIHEKLKRNGKLIIIIPNIESKNFQNFQAKNPDVNTFMVSKAKFQNILEEIGYQIEVVEPLVFTHFHGRLDTKILFFCRHYYLNWIEKNNRKKGKQTPSYYYFQAKKR